MRAGPAELPAWAGALEEVRAVVLAHAPSAEARRALREAGGALVDGTGPDPLALARRIHAADPALQVVLVAPGEEHTRLKHALLFTPGLGEIWTVTPGQVGPELLRRAAEVTEQRRRYRATRAKLEQGITAAGAERTRRALISDAFLATILQAAPDPVVSVDGSGSVLSWNPAAERLLGRPAGEAVGCEMAGLLAPHDPAPLRGLVARAVEEPARGEIRFRRAGGDEGIAEVTVTPVEEAGEGIRSVIVHDLTEERRAQEELEAQAAELEAQAAEMQEQAAEMEALNEALQERTREMEDALRARSRFYAAMSHELRTPINAIIGYNSLLLDGIYGPVPESQAYGLRRAQLAAQHLLELVNDVLDLAKIEAGRIEMQVERVTFPALVEELLETVGTLAERHGSELLLEGPPEPHTVMTDPRRVRQILLNLLSNAIKFGDGKPIRVVWEPLAGGGAEVRVVDRGRGIAPDDLQRIFEEFEQVESGGETGGTGLGLPISRRLAHLLGGTLRVESAPGEGSTFTLVLPPSLPAELPRWRTGEPRGG